MKIILATNNKHKVSEIKKILKLKGLEVLSLLDFPQKYVPRENGKTFEENAYKKASAVAKKFGITAVADDSGLCVKALHGCPGVHSATYVRPPVTAVRLCEKILREMRHVPHSKRGAKFITVVAIVEPGGKSHELVGSCSGRITDEMRGSCGFGYDSVFVPRGHTHTFAEMSLKRKNAISHRGSAFRKARHLLAGIIAKA